MIEYHALLLALLVGTLALFTVLSVLNVRHGAREVAANEEWLRDRLGVEDPDRLIEYTRAGAGTSLLRSWVLMALLLGGLYAGVVTAAVEALAATGLHPVVQGTAFFLGLLVVYRAATAPFGLFETFVIEELFGFNETTPRLWLRDFAVGLAIALALSGLLVAPLLALVEFLPALYWVVGGWLLVVGFGLAMQVLYPRVIAPLFNDFETVEAGELREAVEDVFDRAGFEASEIYTMDASRRSSHLNAYFVGFGRAKRVVLFDTLVEKLGLRQIESVLAHELAHWKRGHIWKRLGATAARTGVVFAVLGYLVTADWPYAMFGFPTEATYAGLFVGLLFVYPLLELSAPLVNRLSLAHEREADAFAVDVMDDGEPMVEALARLASENLANPFPHPWYAAFVYTHPPIPDRIRYIERRTDDGRDATSDVAAG